MHCLPACTMRWHDHFRVEFFQSGYGRGNDPLKERAREVEPADHGVDLLYTGKFLGLADRIDSASMATTSEHHQAFVLDMHDHSLIVVNVGVFLPFVIA